MAELLVWTGGNRNVLDLKERFDGCVTAVKGDGHVWGDGDLTNHRVVKLPGVASADVRFLLEQKVEADMIDGVDERKVTGRRRYLLSSAITDELKALKGNRKTVTKTLANVATTVRGS